MLDACASGWRWTQYGPHFRRLLFRDKTYYKCPKYDEIEVGHIRAIVRLFDIEACAKSKLEILR
mgnify:FL=1